MIKESESMSGYVLINEQFQFIPSVKSGEKEMAHTTQCTPTDYLRPFECLALNAEDIINVKDDDRYEATFVMARSAREARDKFIADFLDSDDVKSDGFQVIVREFASNVSY